VRKTALEVRTTSQ